MTSRSSGNAQILINQDLGVFLYKLWRMIKNLRRHPPKISQTKVSQLSRLATPTKNDCAKRRFLFYLRCVMQQFTCGSGAVELLSQYAMVTIIFETHSTKLANEKGIASGKNDVALSPLGKRQAAELGQRRTTQQPVPAGVPNMKKVPGA